MNNDSIPKKTTVHNTPQSTPTPLRRWFAAGELLCAGPACDKPNPAGYYGRRKRIYFCCHNCYTKYYFPRRPKVRCTFCGRKFPKRPTKHTKPFCCEAHFYAWRRKNTELRVGRFRPVLQEYMEAAGSRGYAPGSMIAIRFQVVSFLEFLVKAKIRGLNAVKPRTISAFLTALRKRRPKSASYALGQLHVFFDWLIESERRKLANPVLASVHRQQHSKRLPRPYSDEQLALIWKLLKEAGDLNLMVAVSLGEQSALRISEACNLRVQDINLAAQEAFVRLPNKTRTERVVSFHDRSRQLLTRLLAQRGEYKDDFLLRSVSGKPMFKHTLRLRLLKVLIGEGKLPSFSFHRLRHRAATAMRRAGADTLTTMRTFGWTNPAVAQGYLEILPEEIRETYNRAMSKQEQRQLPTVKRQSIAEFFANSAPAPATVDPTPQ